MHLHRLNRYGDVGVYALRFRGEPTLEKVLAETIETPEGCWEWAGPRSPRGYGRWGTCGRVSRIAWTLANGPIPEGLIVRHRCDNPPCCNPDHLEIGTHSDNSKDTVGRGRQAKGEAISGSKLTEGDVLAIRKRYAETKVPQWKLGEEYGVTQANISDIVRRKTWTHILDEGDRVISTRDGHG